MFTSIPERPSALTVLRRRVHRLRRVVPAGLALLVIIYEAGPARWLLDRAGENYHLLAEILVYGALGPALAYLLLHFLDRWLEERETSELQAQLLAEARAGMRIGRKLSDDALQTLFAASILLASLKATSSQLPPETAVGLLKTEQALDRAIQQLRGYLQNESTPQVIPEKE